MAEAFAKPDAWSSWKPTCSTVACAIPQDQDETSNSVLDDAEVCKSDQEDSEFTFSGEQVCILESPIAEHSAVDTLESPSADSDDPATWQQTLCIPSQHALGKFISTYLEELQTVLNACDDDEVEEIMETLSPLLAKAVQNHPTMEDCYALFEASDKFDMPEIDGVFACMKGNRSFAGPIWIAIQSIVLHRDSKPAPLIE